MNWTWNALQEKLIRIVEANHLDSATHFEIGFCKLAYGFWRTTMPLGKSYYNMERAHGTTIPQFRRMNLR